VIPIAGKTPPPRLPAALAGALERAAGAIARLDSALASHPLRSAWAWRARLDAVRRQAAVDGQAIDPWHLAALIEGVRFRLGRSPALIDRGAVFAAAQHAFGLYRWFSAPDEAQQAAIAEAAAHLDSVGDGHSPLLGAALGVHAWLDRGGERPPLRAALAAYWVRRGGDRPALPALDRCQGVARRGAVGARGREFLAALAAEAEAGLALLGLIGRHWFAAPLLSATSLAQALGMPTNAENSSSASRIADQSRRPPEQHTASAAAEPH
jgi:hypothetical protein